MKSLILSLMVTLFTNSLMAQDAPAQTLKHKHFKSFRRGVCVGQTLAQEGIVLPPPQPGQDDTGRQKPALDPQTAAAFKAASQACRAAYNG